MGKGGDFRGVANEMKLTVADSGLVSSSGNISGLGPVPEIQALFSLEKRGVSDVIPPKGEAVLTLQEIVPNFTPPLGESIRARVIDEFKQSRARDKPSPISARPSVAEPTWPPRRRN